MVTVAGVLLMVVSVFGCATSGRQAGSATGPASSAAPQGNTCPPGFPVKGNINERGERIYHKPVWRYYDRTAPERCFETPSAAEEAGFRASKVR